jgi:cysteine synthase A
LDTGVGYSDQAFGAELVLTPAANGMSGAIKKAEQIQRELGDKAVILQQFNNPANARIHRYVGRLHVTRAWA